MTGVEILAVQEFVTAYMFNWNMYLTIVGTVTLSMTIVVGLIFLSDCGLNGFLFGFVISIVVSGLLALIPASCTLPKSYETQYKVTISDEVSMNEFLERYEIIEQEGKIYTVREIEDDR